MSVAGPQACDGCLRRSWLVGSLSEAIERAGSGRGVPRTRELLALPDDALVAAVGMTGGWPPAGLKALDAVRLREAVGAAKCWAACVHGRGYPIQLCDLGDPPAAIFGRGDSARLDAIEPGATVTVVGARRPSGYGRDRATTLAADLGSAGVVIVSGMAFGIDSCAHRGALDAGGATVAVLGSGPDLATPQRMRGLHAEIVERGIVISELPPGTGAKRWTFPARNRLMAALGAITVVVEARGRSGSLITATMAADLGREVGATPGRVGESCAEGANALLRDGAQVIRSAQDVLDSLLGAGSLSPAVSAARAAGGSPPLPGLDERQSRLLELIELAPGGVDAIAAAAGAPAAEVAAALTRLEMAGQIACDAAGCFRRRMSH